MAKSGLVKVGDELHAIDGKSLKMLQPQEVLLLSDLVDCLKAFVS